MAVTATTREDEGTRRVRLSASYLDALERAGLVPLVIPPLDNTESASAIIEAVDGLLLTGGEDVNPSLYGTDPHPKLKRVNDRRDAMEIALILEARKRRTPVLAICRGIQVLNVAFGGTLIQDIAAECPGALNHDDDSPRNSRIHEIAVEPSTRTSQALGATRVKVNSIHHQAVKDVAPELIVTARAPDGVIEGVETLDPDWWVLAVQWHPEEMTESPDSPDRGLFSSFADQLAKPRKS